MWAIMIRGRFHGAGLGSKRVQTVGAILYSLTPWFSFFFFFVFLEIVMLRLSFLNYLNVNSMYKDGQLFITINV